MPALDQLIEARNIEGLKTFDEGYQKYLENYENFKYLESVSETWLFTNYISAIKYDSLRPFSNEFTLENRDMLYRLKFKALNAVRADDALMID